MTEQPSIRLGGQPRPVGPQPLSEGDRDQLRGRESDLSTLLSAVRNAQVVIVTARSGVGKTSLIRAGLLDALREAGFVTARLTSWSPSPSGAAGWMESLAEAIEAVTGRARRTDVPADQYLAEMDALFGDRLVLVFDQVEEFFRFDKSVGENLLDAVIGALTADWPFSFRYVLALRSEHWDNLARLEQALDPRDCTTCRLLPVADGSLPEIIASFPRGAASFSDRATAAIMRIWMQAASARGKSGPGSQEPLGLLEFRALLWVIYRKIGDGQRVEQGIEAPAISEEAVLSAARMLIRLEGSDHLTDQEARELVESALAIYVETELGRRRDDVQATSYDERMEAWSMASRIVPHLSSGSFKVVRTSPDLAALALPRLTDVLPAAYEGRDVVRSVIAAVEATSGDSASLPSEVIEDVVVSRWRDTRFARDVGENSAAGRLYGGSSAQVIAALVLAYERSLVWLEAAGVLRVAPAPGGVRSVSLTHDGFGPALMGWAARAQMDTAVPIHSLIAVTGRQVLRSAPTSRRSPLGRAGDLATPTLAERVGDGAVRRVIWQGCYVSGYLKDVEFVECDFRGSIFSDVELDGVTFRDCVMWGVLFREARIFGGGVTISTSGSGFLTEMRTLTFGGGVSFSGAGLRLVGQQGYGLFLNGPVGGPVVLEGCRIEHLTFSGARVSEDEDPLGLGPIQLHPSTSLSHVVLGKGLKALDLAGGTAEYVSNPADARVIESGR